MFGTDERFWPTAAETRAIEAEPWFQNLPAAQRAGVLQARLIKELRFEWLANQARPRWHRPAREGIFLFVGVITCAYPLAWSSLLAATVIGALTGLLWHLLKAESLLAILISMSMFSLLGGYVPNNYIVASFSMVAIGSIAAWLGLQRSTDGA